MREAITEYTVLEEREGFSYIEARPKTGRTHQIRVHFKAIHHPVVCDRLYAPKHECALGFSRVALHAKSIAIQNIRRETRTLEAELPEDFVKALGIFHTLPTVAR
jgi:23S rRNA pseudouridine1911/1915/1917 synthase